MAKKTKKPAKQTAPKAAKQVTKKRSVLESLKQPADHRTTGLVLGTGTGLAVGSALGGLALFAALGAGAGYLLGHAARGKKK